MSILFPLGKVFTTISVFIVNGEKDKELQPTSGKILKKLNFGPDEKSIEITYESQGMDKWWYLFGSDVSQIRNFKLTMITDFDEINLPEYSISPIKRRKKVKAGNLHGNIPI